MALGVEGQTGNGVLPVSYPFLLEDVGVGESILLADGLSELEVREVKSDRLLCEVLIGSTVTSRKGVNLPQANLRVAAFTEKDRADLEVGLEEGVDFVALSFVRHEDDLVLVSESASRSRSHPPMLIAKIEKPQAVDRLQPILEAVDGVMVARGDLGVEMPPEKVPMIQKGHYRRRPPCGSTRHHSHPDAALHGRQSHARCAPRLRMSPTRSSTAQTPSCSPKRLPSVITPMKRCVCSTVWRCRPNHKIDHAEMLAGLPQSPSRFRT